MHISVPMLYEVVEKMYRDELIIKKYNELMMKYGNILQDKITLQNFILRPFRSGELFNHNASYDIVLYFKEDRIRYDLISDVTGELEIVSEGNRITTDVLQDFKLSRKGKALVKKYL